MRISDWSSDVCSSDLLQRRRRPAGEHAKAMHRRSVSGFQARDVGLGVVGLTGGVGDVGLGGSPGLEPDAGQGLGLALRGSGLPGVGDRSEEHTSELQSLMRISYAVFCLKKK